MRNQHYEEFTSRKSASVSFKINLHTVKKEKKIFITY